MHICQRKQTHIRNLGYTNIRTIHMSLSSFPERSLLLKYLSKILPVVINASSVKKYVYDSFSLLLPISFKKSHNKYTHILPFPVQMTSKSGELLRRSLTTTGEFVLLWELSPVVWSMVYPPMSGTSEVVRSRSLLCLCFLCLFFFFFFLCLVSSPAKNKFAKLKLSLGIICSKLNWL